MASQRMTTRQSRRTRVTNTRVLSDFVCGACGASHTDVEGEVSAWTEQLYGQEQINFMLTLICPSCGKGHEERDPLLF